MTGDLLLDSVISLAAIALMVAFAWFMFSAPPLKVTKEVARERLAFDEPDFTPVHWLIDAEGRAALAEDEAGDFALISRLGVDLVTRRYAAGAMRVTVEGGVLAIAPLDPGSRTVKLAAGEAAQWARKFAGAVAS